MATVIISPPGSGKVTQSTNGDVVTLTATANIGYRFHHWVDNWNGKTETNFNNPWVDTLAPGAGDVFTAYFVANDAPPPDDPYTPPPVTGGSNTTFLIAAGVLTAAAVLLSSKNGRKRRR